MESSRMLHESLSQNCCLCHIEATTILQQLDLSLLVTGQGSDGEISMSTRDEVLVRLGLITSLNEMNHCSKLEEVQQALLASGLFENLHSLLSSTDQLVVYCASKCLKVHLQKLAKNDKCLAQDFLRRAVASILDSRDEFDKDRTSSVINRTIFTLDLLTNIIRGGSIRSSNEEEDQNTPPCMSTSTSAEDEGSKLNSQSHDNPTFDVIEWYCDVITENISELCAVFSSQHGMVSDQHRISSHQEPSWLQSLEISSKHKICHACLRLLYSYTKVQMKRDPHSVLSFTQSTLPHLQALLKTYCQGSVANLKLVLSILILSIKICVKACESQKHLVGVESCNGTSWNTLCDSWRRLEAAICGGDWLENMPYHGGHVGFGGSTFPSGEEVNSSSDEYSIGDIMILRKLACLVILRSELEVVSSGTMSNQGSRHIEHISHFIVSKLRGTSSCKEETTTPGAWIFGIFGDQDDALIGIMLNLLKINLSAKSSLDDRSSLDEKTCKSSKSVDTGTDEVEIPAECKNQWTLDAHHVFISFLDHMTWDHSILLDLLISTETDFLEYFIRYLRLVATDWEGFLSVQRLRRKKEEDVSLSSGGDTDGDDDDIHSNVDSDGDDVEEDEFNNADDTDYKQDFDDRVSENSVGSVNQDDNNEELCGQTESGQDLKSSECVNLKRKQVQNEDMKENAAKKFQKTEREGPHDISKATMDMKKASCNELIDQEKDDDLRVHAVAASASGCLDDTMTILIRLRLAIERLNKKGLFPFSVAPLIRLLVQVEDMYEDIAG